MIVASSERTGVAVLIKAPLTANVIHEIAEAIVYEKGDVFSQVIRSHFAAELDVQPRWYCLDMAEAVCRITFSAKAKPRLFYFRGVAAQVAPTDAIPLALRVQAVDSIRPGRLREKQRHAHLNEETK